MYSSTSPTAPSSRTRAREARWWHALISTQFDATSTALDVVAGHDLTGVRAVVTGGGSGIGVETVRAWRPRAPRSPSPSATPSRATPRRRTSSAPPGTPRSGWRGWTCSTWTRSRRSSPTGTARCTCWSTTPGSWRCRSSPSPTAAGDPVRHQPPRPLRPHHRPARRAGRGRGRPGRVGLQHRAPALAGRLRRHPLRAARVRPVVGLRAVQDRQRPARRRGHPPLGRRRHRGQRAHAGRDHDQPPAARLPGRPRRLGEGAAGGHRHLQDPEQGAATTLVAAVAPEFATGGHYLEDCAEARTVADDEQTRSGVRAWALDAGNARRLWEVSEEHLAQRPDAATEPGCGREQRERLRGAGKSFERDTNYIEDRILADGSQGWPVEADRYRLVVARACPWANRPPSSGVCWAWSRRSRWASAGPPTTSGPGPSTSTPAAATRCWATSGCRRPSSPATRVPRGITVPAMVDLPTKAVVTNDFAQMTLDFSTEWTAFHRDGAPDLYRSTCGTRWTR